MDEKPLFAWKGYSKKLLRKDKNSNNLSVLSEDKLVMEIIQKESDYL